MPNVFVHSLQDVICNQTGHVFFLHTLPRLQRSARLWVESGEPRPATSKQLLCRLPPRWSPWRNWSSRVTALPRGTILRHHAPIKTKYDKIRPCFSQTIAIKHNVVQVYFYMSDSKSRIDQPKQLTAVDQEAPVEARFNSLLTTQFTDQIQ